MENQETNNEPLLVKQLRNHAKQLRVREYNGAQDCQRYIILDDAIKIFKATNGSKPIDKDWILNELEYLMNECIVLGQMNSDQFMGNDQLQVDKIEDIKQNLIKRLV